MLAPLTEVNARAERPRAMLPPQLNDPTLDSLYDVGERPIWQEAPRHAIAQYRVSFIGINCKRHMIRFGEQGDGSARGEVKVWNGCHKDEPYESHSFRFDKLAFAPLKEAMAEARLWQRPATYWGSQDEDTICIDGIDVTYERRDLLDYRMDRANVWCSTTLEFVSAARMLLIAAGDRSGLGLLPEITNDR